MFETIVWATDGSELADRALPYVKQLARTNGSGSSPFTPTSCCAAGSEAAR